MIEPLPTCSAPNYSHVPSPEWITSVATQLNYITDIVVELKIELAKIWTEVKEINKQLSVIQLSLVNEIGHSVKSTLSISSPF